MKCRCRCDNNYEATRMFYSAMAEVLTDQYAVFSKTVLTRFLFFTVATERKAYVLMPKQYRGNYEVRQLEAIKEMISLVDNGYINPEVTEEVVDRWRSRIAEYQINKNEVWE